MDRQAAFDKIVGAFALVDDINNGYGVDPRKKEVKLNLRKCDPLVLKSCFKTPSKPPKPTNVNFHR